MNLNRRKGGFDYDNMIQVYEGEDLNLDGGMDGSVTSWDFDGITHEFRGSGNAETSPISPNSDDDDMPDGFEVWYSTQEPYTNNGGTLILDPTVDDGSLDLDPDGYESFFNTDQKSLFFAGWEKTGITHERCLCRYAAKLYSG